MSKLTLHFQSSTPWMTQVVRGGPFAWVKWLGPSGPDLWPGVKTIGRFAFSDGPEVDAMIGRGRAGAEEWWARVGPSAREARWVWCWEGPNERPVKTPEQRRALAAFSVRFAELAHAEGFRVALGVSSTGTPPLAAFDGDGAQALAELRPLYEAADYWAIHCYGIEAMAGGSIWHPFRYRQLVKELRAMGVPQRPVLITETGIESGGWRKHLSWREYQDQLAWYSVELDKDPEVLAACIFTSGHIGWEGHAFEEAEARWLAEFVRAHPTAVVPVQPPADGPQQMPSPNFGYPRGTRGRNGHKAIAIVYHVAGGSLTALDAWVRDAESKVSYHYGIGRSGEIHQYVQEGDAAWHAGGVNKSAWPLLVANANPNLYTLGISLEGMSGEPVTEPAYQALLKVTRGILARQGIQPSADTLVGHCRIDSVNRTYCPGPAFPWARLLADLGVLTPPPAAGLPEDETATDPATLAEKSRWWCEEMQREYAAGHVQRAEAIRLSLIKLLYRLETTLEAR